MAFFHFEEKKSDDFLRGTSIEFLHENQCKVCPLNKQSDLAHPHMDPYGSSDPIVYMLGEAPGKEEDRKGRPFVGKAGRVLRFRIPESWLDHLRWNNCVRTRPPKNRTPEHTEIECCRPSVVKDIEQTKPVAIFGFGAVPLKWALDEGGISKWCGRRIPVKIGNHTCWYYPIFHPSYVLRTRRFTPQSTSEYGCDEEFVFAANLEKAFAEVERLPDPVVHTEKFATSGIEIIDGSRGWRDVDRVKQILKDMAGEDVVGLDYETNRLRPYAKGAKILSVALSGDRVGTAAIALEHREAGWSSDQLDAVFDAFEDFLYDAPCLKVVHNLAFELEWSGVFFGRSVVRAQPWGDTISQAYILDERQGALSLGDLTLQYFGLNIKSVTPVNTKDLDNTPIDRVLLYNGVDAKYHRLLYQAQAPRIEEEELVDVYAHQLRRVPTMVLSQMGGVPVDLKVNKDLYKDFTELLEEIEDELSELDCVKRFKEKTNKTFSPTANKDVLFVINNILGKAVDNTDKTVLKALDHEFGDLMLEHREFSKVVSTYLEPLREPNSCVYPDGLMHPIIAVTKTRTWRTSSEIPNVQNWPKREHKEVRKQVKPGGNKKVVSFDYAGIQARNVAMESHDENLVAAFWDRYDIHKDWMERVVKLHPKWVKEGAKALAKDKDLAKAYRHRSKNQLVFPLFFGASPKSVSRDLGIPESIGEALSEEFWDRFSGIRAWQEQTRDNYLRTGYVTGLSGFRRRAPVAWNEVINTPIQSDEAIIVCDAMSRLSELGDPRFQAAMEIHDDLTFIWDAREVDKNAEVVIGMMLDVPYEWARVVPIGVEMSIGDDWAYQKEVGEYFSDKWDGNFKQIS